MDTTTQRWRAVQSTFGVSRLVCSGAAPAAMPNEVIVQLKSREDERGFVQLEQRPPFVAGDKIQILAGIFTSCLGLFEGMMDSERVAVLLDLLGRKARVVLDADCISAA